MLSKTTGVNRMMAQMTTAMEKDVSFERCGCSREVGPGLLWLSLLSPAERVHVNVIKQQTRSMKAYFAAVHAE